MAAAHARSAPSPLPSYAPSRAPSLSRGVPSAHGHPLAHLRHHHITQKSTHTAAAAKRQSAARAHARKRTRTTQHLHTCTQLAVAIKRMPLIKPVPITRPLCGLNARPFCCRVRSCFSCLRFVSTRKPKSCTLVCVVSLLHARTCAFGSRCVFENSTCPLPKALLCVYTLRCKQGCAGKWIAGDRGVCLDRAAAARYLLRRVICCRRRPPKFARPGSKAAAFFSSARSQSGKPMSIPFNDRILNKQAEALKEQLLLELSRAHKPFSRAPSLHNTRQHSLAVRHRHSNRSRPRVAPAVARPRWASTASPSCWATMRQSASASRSSKTTLAARSPSTRACTSTRCEGRRRRS